VASVESKQKISSLQGKIDQLEKRDNIIQKKLQELEKENLNLKKEMLQMQSGNVTGNTLFDEDKTE